MVATWGAAATALRLIVIVKVMIIEIVGGLFGCLSTGGGKEKLMVMVTVMVMMMRVVMVVMVMMMMVGWLVGRLSGVGRGAKSPILYITTPDQPLHGGFTGSR